MPDAPIQFTLSIEGWETTIRNLMPTEVDGDYVQFHGIGEPADGDFWHVYGRVEVGTRLEDGKWMLADRVSADELEEILA